MEKLGSSCLIKRVGNKDLSPINRIDRETAGLVARKTQFCDPVSGKRVTYESEQRLLL